MTPPHNGFVSPGSARAGLDWASAQRALMALLAASWVARIALAASGGQYFFPDEARFDRSLEFVRLASGGHLGAAFQHLLARADHAGWTIVGLLPATITAVLGELTGRAAEQFAYLVAMLLSLASVSCIALVFQISRRLGGSPEEALTAAVLLSLAASFFYWSRHLVPYDTAMALSLAALSVGLCRGGVARNFATGLLAGAAFLVYNGYWTIAALVVALNCAVGARQLRRLAVRSAAAAAGFALPTAVLLLSIRVAGGPNGIAKMREFAGTVTQGDWSDGFALPFAYLWSADRLLLIPWMIAIVVTLGWLVRPSVESTRRALDFAALYRWRPGSDPESRAALLLACVVIVYASLAGGSAIGRVFVVYGRLARQLVPFLCLLTACVGITVYQRAEVGKRAVISAAAITTVVQLLIAFGPPLRQVFPRELEAHLFPYRPLGYALAVAGPTPREGDSTARFILVNAQYLYPPRGPQALPSGAVIFSFPHPLQYAPYRYEGFRDYERAILAGSDISMRLLDRGAVAAP